MSASAIVSKPPAVNDPWISVREAARQLGIARTTVLTWVIQGKLEATTVAGRTFVNRESVERALGTEDR